MTVRPVLRLLLLAAMLLAPLGRIGIAQAVAMPSGSAMTGHCAGMPAAAPARHKSAHLPGTPQKNGEQMAVDCMIACAAMAPASAAPFAPPAPAEAMSGAILPSSLTGIRPEADPPPPRGS